MKNNQKTSHALGASRLSVELGVRIRELEAGYGGLRPAARELGCDVAYLMRLRDGEKTNPSDAFLKKLGLKRIVIYVRDEWDEKSFGQQYHR